jgi:uncharacterized protein YqeY
MNLEERINIELKDAMKTGKKDRLDALRSLRASILEFNKSGAGRSMNEDDEIKLLKSAAKQRKDAIEMYEKGNRTDLADKEKFELAVIEEFLPEQLSDEEIKAAVNKIVLQTGASSIQDMGKVMGLAMKELKGQADGNKVKDIVKEILG